MDRPDRPEWAPEYARYWRGVANEKHAEFLKLEHTHAKLKHELFWWRILAWLGLAGLWLMNVAFYIAAFVAPPAHWSMLLANFLGRLT